MIYLDIDNFRNFNNTYGHHAGDKLLRSCADIIKSYIRSSDMAYRYGGEELVIILVGSIKKEAVRIGQSIVENIHNYDNTLIQK